MAIKTKDIRNLRVDMDIERYDTQYARPAIMFEAGDARYHIWLCKPGKCGQWDGTTWKPYGFLYKNAIEQPKHGRIPTRQLDLENASNSLLVAWLVTQPEVDLPTLSARMATAHAEAIAERDAKQAEALTLRIRAMRNAIHLTATKMMDEAAVPLMAFAEEALDTEILGLLTAMQDANKPEFPQ